MPEKKNKGGHPPKYKTANEMQKVIDAYFTECEGNIVVDEEGHAITDKYGVPVKVGCRPLTITGLALALGFTSRQALLNYEAKDEFVDTITRAKAKVEQYAEERLFDKDGCNGAKFNLSNNFSGWSERQQIDNNISLAPVVFTGGDEIAE